MSKCSKIALGIILIVILCLGFFLPKMQQVKSLLAYGNSWGDRLGMIYFKVLDKGNVYELLRRAYYTFHVPYKGVIHIGAHHGQELKYYEHYKLPDVLWIEADPEREAELKKSVSGHAGSKIAMFAAADKNGTITFHQVSNEGASSSILSLKHHLDHYPGITETKSFDVPARRLDDYLSDAEKTKYNIIVIDVQGAELIALSGAVKTLENIDAIIAETNYSELYENGVLVSDLDKFLLQHGFTRVDAMSCTHYTGDALYIKQKFFK